MPTRARVRALLPLCGVLLLATVCGCAYLKQFAASIKKPSLVFQSASLGAVTLGGATLNLTYRLENPNPIALKLASIRYALSVEGKQVVAGSPPKGLNIPASGHTELVFPANVRFMDLGQVLTTFLTKDTAAYKAEGTIGIDTPLGVLSVPLSKEGTFEVPKAPQVQFSAPRITTLNLSSATVEFPITVTNRSSYALPISGMDGTLQLAGANIGSVDLGDLGTLPGKGLKQVKVPLTIHFGEVASAAAALTRGSGTVAFNGTIRSGPAALPLKFSQDLKFQR